MMRGRCSGGGCACSRRVASLLGICSFTCLPCLHVIPTAMCGGACGEVHLQRRVCKIVSGDVVCRLRLSSLWRVSPRLGLRREVVYGLGLEPFVGCLLVPFRVMAFHVCARDGFLGEETLRLSSGVFLRLFFIIQSGSVCAGQLLWFSETVHVEDFLIRWVIRLRRVSCFHVFEHVIPALEPSAWSLCVLVDVLFRLVR
ncbi:hypothetical protein YC2023_044359 [Brassica napus]